MIDVTSMLNSTKSNTLSNLSNSTGAVAKAFICVRNPNALKKEYNQDETIKTTKKFQLQLMAASKARMSEAVNSTKGSSTMSSMSQTIGLREGEREYCFLEVQYNPASLYFSITGGRFINNDRGGTIGAVSNNAMIDRDYPTTLTMNCQLIVEDIHIQDAFALKPTEFSNTFNSSIVGALNLGQSLSDDGFSVRKTVEALVAILMQKQLQDIFFYWGKMYFHGQLISVNSNYTMFNPKGNPIKATIDIQLQQMQDSKLYSLDNKYWNDAYKKAFQTENDSMNTAKDMISNLTNIKL